MTEEKKEDELKSKVLTELEDSEERLKLLFEYAPDAFYIYDLEGNFVDGNRAAEELVGYKRGELIGKNFFKIGLIPLEHMPRVIEAVARNALGQPAEIGELTLKRKDGTHVTVEIKTFPVKPKGKALILGLARDITERKGSEGALRESERKLREAQEMAHLGFWRWDVLTGDVEWSEEVYKIFCLDPREFTPHIDSIQALSPWPEDHERNEELIRKATESHEEGTYEQRFLRPDKSIGYYFSTFQGKYDERSNLIFIVGTVQDITDRKKSEEELKWKTAFLESQMEAGIDGVLVVDNQGQRILINNRLLEMWDVPEHIRNDKADEPLLQYVVSRTKNPEQFLDKVKYLYSHQDETSRDEVEFKDGTVFDRYSSPVNDKHGTYYGRIWTFRDITERKKADEALRESEERYRAMFDSANDIILTLDRLGVVTSVNRQITELSGYSQEELVGKNLASLKMLTPASIALVLKNYAMRLIGVDVQPYVIDVVSKTGRKMFFEVSATSLKEEGRIVGDLAILRDITERRRAEATLRESEEKFRGITERSFDVIFTFDVKGNFTYVSPAVEKIIGYSPGELIGKSFSGFMQQDNDINPSELFAGIVTQKKAISNLELRIPKKDGTILYAEVNASPVVVDDAVVGIQGVLRDVTDRKMAQEELRETNAYLNNLFNYANVPIIVWSPQFKIIRFNQASELLTGRSAGEVLGQTIDLLFPPAQMQSTMELIRKASGGERWQTVEIEILYRDGTVRTVLWNSATIFDSDGKVPVATIAQGQDITKRKCAEETLKESEGRFSDIALSIGEWIWETDAEGRYTYSSPTVEKILGYTSEEVLGRCFYEFVCLDEREQVKAGALAAFTRKEVFKNFLNRNVHKDGSIVILETSGVPILAADGRLLGYRGVDRDITHHKQTEDELRKSEEQHRLLFENAGVGIGYYTPDGIIHGFNKLAVQNLGGRPEDYVGKSLLDVFGKEQGSLYLSRLTEAAQSSGALEFEDMVNLPTGMKWFASTYTRVCGGDGKVTAIQIISQDITERRQASERLKQASDEWQNTFDSITDMIFLIDRDFKITKVNKAFCTYMTAKPEELIGKRCYEVMHKSDSPWKSCPQVKLLQDKLPHSEEVLDEQIGIPLLISVSPIFDERGEIVGAVHVAMDITERKKSEDALRESGEKYRNIFENAIEGIFQSTPEGRYLNVNPAFARMFGFESPQEMISSVADIKNIYVYPAERAKIKDRILTEGFVRDYEAEFRHRDGRRIWGSINEKAIKDKDGRILHYEGTTEDITNRKLDEERMMHTNRQLMGIIDFLPDATFVVDKDSKVFAWNRAMEELTGMSSEKAVGKGNEVYSKILYGMQRPTLMDSMFQPDSKILEKYSYVERRGYVVYAESFAPMLRNGMGAYLWLVASPLFDEQGNLIGAVETIRDITEQKKADDEIRKLSKAVESSPNAVIVTDLSGKIEYVNDALPKIGHFNDKNEAIGRSVFEFAAGTEADRLKTEIIPIILSKGQWSGEMLLCRSDRSTYFADMVCSVISDERGNPKYLFATFHDISDRKQAEEKLKVSQQQQKAILDNIPDLVWLKDVERRFIAVNEAYGRMLNLKSEELISKTELDVWPKEMAEKYMADDAEVMSFGRRKSTEASVVDRHGRSRWMETIKTPIFDEGGNVVGTAGISRDTTERRNMEEKLQEVNRRFNDIIEFFPDATFVIDREGKVLAWNRAIEEMTGVRKEDIVGKGEFAYAIPFYGERRPILIDIVFKSDAELQSEYISISKKGNILIGEAFTPKLHGGRGAYLAGTASLLKDEHGNVVGAIEAIRDISEAKKSAEELKAKVTELERFNKLMVGRELKMIELKREINSILDRTGEPPRYSVPVSDIKRLMDKEKGGETTEGSGVTK